MKFFCFKPSDPSSRGRKIHQSPKSSDFRVDVDIHTCVHGYLAKNKKQPASLIIFHVQLISTKEGTFDRLNLDVTFDDIVNKNTSTNLAHPQIVSVAPFQCESPQNRLSRIWKREEILEIKKTGEVSIGAGLIVPDAKIGAKLGRNKKDYSKLVTNGEFCYYGKGSSSTRVDEAGRRTGVWWNVKKSSAPDLKDDAGLQPNYLFAVLLTRSSATLPFEARMHFTIDARKKDKKATSSQLFGKDKAVRRPNTIKRLSSGWINQVDDAKGNAAPIVFDPRVMVEGYCDKIDTNRLQRYEDSQELAKLTTVQMR